MPRTPAQKQATDRYRARNGRVQVNTELTPEICRRWQAYAGSRGMSLTAIAHECVVCCMAEDSLAAEDGVAASPAGAAHAAGGPRSMRPARVDPGYRGHGGHGLSPLAK